MRSAASITQTRLLAFTARARFWLWWVIGVVSRIAPLNGSRRLHAYIDRADRWIERLLFLAACARLRRPPQRSAHPRSTPPGYRRARTQRALLFKRARIRRRNATLAERLAHLAAVLDAPEPIIARLVKRLRRGLTASRLVLVAPRARTLAAQQQAVVTRFDSS